MVDGILEDGGGGRTRLRERASLSAPSITADAVMGASVDGIVVIDRDGAIVEFNPAAEQMFGYSRAQTIGVEMATLLIPPALRERHRRAVREAREGSGSREQSILDRRLELIGMRSDGTEFPLELTVTLLSEDPVLYAGFVRDVTERRRITEGKELLAAASAAFD